MRAESRPFTRFAVYSIRFVFADTGSSTFHAIRFLHEVYANTGSSTFFAFFAFPFVHAETPPCLPVPFEVVCAIFDWSPITFIRWHINAHGELSLTCFSWRRRFFNISWTISSENTRKNAEILFSVTPYSRLSDLNVNEIRVEEEPSHFTSTNGDDPISLVKSSTILLTSPCQPRDTH